MHITFNEIIADLKRKEQIFNEELNFQSIEYCSYIVEVGGLTVNTDEQGNVSLLNTAHPMLYSLKAANEISKFNFICENGVKVFAKIYSRNDWYRSKVKAIRWARNKHR